MQPALSFPLKRTRCLTIPLVLLALASAAGSQAQEAQQPAPTFSEAVDVQIVNVEVWVTDRKGNPITGLTADDFVLLEDGKPVDVSYFAEIRDPTVGSAEATLIETATVEAPEEPAPATEAAEDVSPASSQAHLVIYFDQLNLQPSGREELIGDLQALLESQRVPAERVLILRQDNDLFTVAPFGSSFEELDVALDQVAASTVRGAQSAQQKRLAIDRLQDAWQQSRENASRAPAQANTSADSQACDLFARRAMPDIEMYSRETLNRISTSVDHLTSVVSFLAGLPGHKTLLYLSDALETSPGNDLLGFVQAVCPGTGVTSNFDAPEGLRQPFHALTRHANANRVTIYAMQPLGLRTVNLASAQTGGFDFRALNRLSPLVRENERDGLAFLASETGGRAIFNQGDLSNALVDMASDMRNYYSLAYEPKHGGDRAEHKIEVKVPGQRTRVRHRRGYRDKSPDQRMHENLLGALHLGLVTNPLEVSLGQGDLRATKRKRYDLPLHVFLPSTRVAYLPGADGNFANLTVKVMARNTDDPAVAMSQKRFMVQQPPPDETMRLDLPIAIELPEGINLIAIGVRDEATRETSYVSTTVQIGAGIERRP